MVDTPNWMSSADVRRVTGLSTRQGVAYQAQRLALLVPPMAVRTPSGWLVDPRAVEFYVAHKAWPQITSEQRVLTSDGPPDEIDDRRIEALELRLDLEVADRHHAELVAARAERDLARVELDAERRETAHLRRHLREVEADLESIRVAYAAALRGVADSIGRNGAHSRLED